MKHLAILATALCSLAFTQVSVANSEDCNYTWVLWNEDGSPTTPEQHTEKERREAECKRNKVETQRQAADARKRLQSEFGIDASGLPDNEAIGQLQSEIDKKKSAEKDAASAKALAAEKQRQTSIDAAMKKQDDMLKGMGVNMGVMEADASDDSDPPSAVELQMYQKMLDEGVAPHCKGKKGWVMIDCVDAATVED